MGLLTRIKSGWNAFLGRDPTSEELYDNIGPGYSYRLDRPRFSRGNEKSIITSVYNRFSLDVSSININHVRLDENNRFIEVIDSSLNECLTLSANIDQTGRAFIQDIVISMLDEGCVAVVPVDCTNDPRFTDSYDILSMRTGKITQWYPEKVKVEIYNDRTGMRVEKIFSKDRIAIIENPFYSVINEPNSTMQRLIRKLALLDMTDNQNASGKLNIIIQLPYVIKTKTRQQQAEKRREDIERQLMESKYGIAYTDGTEHITQLNRAIDNNLMSQIEYLTTMLFSQLGMTQEILNGTASEEVMLNYYNRTIEPMIAAITDEMKRKFLSRTARTQKQSIMFFRDPFRLVPISNIAEIADKFTRNEIMSSNEIRQIVGMKRSEDPSADELRNKNLSQSKVEQQAKMEDYGSEEDLF